VGDTENAIPGTVDTTERSTLTGLLRRVVAPFDA